MDFAFSEDQDLLRQEVRKFLEAQSPLPEVRAAASSPDGYSKAIWKQLGELGFLGLMLPADYGGADLGWVDLVVLLEESGRQLLPSPLISTVLTGMTILDEGSDAQRERYLPGLADASRVGALALFESADRLDADGIALRGHEGDGGFVLTGRKDFVTDADRADVFIVAFRTDDGPDDLALGLVERDASGVTVERAETLDKTKQTGSLVLDHARVEPSALLGVPGHARPAIERLLDRGALATTAEAIGSMEGALDITVEFAKQRIQFGHPIGHYQGVKHPLADAYVDIECLKSLLYYTAWAADSSLEHLPLAASEAKLFGSEAFPRLGVTGIQLHGAVGFTEEYDIQLYLKRSKWYRQEFGDEEQHADRIASLGGWS